MTGIGDRRTIFGSASASSVFGTATRTISQPAEARAAICAVVASTSCVFVSVIDWTTTGAPPPIATPPTAICRSLATSRHQSAPTSFVRPTKKRSSTSADAHDRDTLVDLAPDRVAAHLLGDREHDVAAVERQQRQQVEQAEREADEREHREVRLPAPGGPPTTTRRQCRSGSAICSRPSLWTMLPSDLPISPRQPPREQRPTP